MKKLLLAVLCSLPLLPALARADDTKTSSGDAMQGDAMGHGEMKPDAKKKHDKKAKHEKKAGDAKMQGDGMMQGGSVQQGGHMDSDMKK